MKNLALPGNPRYQPKELVSYFGYDNLYRGVGEVELATLTTLAKLGKIPPEQANQLTPALREAVLEEITTSQVDEIERRDTKHDIRAWVRCAQQIFEQHGAGELGRWLHVPLTSYDALHTGRILLYLRAWRQALRPSGILIMKFLAQLVELHASKTQVGRTHGQHALPITVGFWLATLLHRISYNMLCMQRAADNLVGKISGAVGAYNAQIGLQFDTQGCRPTFEERVLAELQLRPAPISTQILPPEPLAYFLHAACMLSASLGQFGMDCRHLMRTEIREVAEPRKPGAVGSSTMPHKINPAVLEGLQGAWLRNKSEYAKVFDALNSEHQRDLVGSALERDFPIILVNLQYQFNNLLRPDKDGVAFLSGLVINEQALHHNLQLQANVFLAEPLYIALVAAGYKHDAHKLVAERLTPQAQANGTMLVDECARLAETDEVVREAWQRIPTEIVQLLRQPEQYVGRAAEKAREIAALTRQTIAQLS